MDCEDQPIHYAGLTDETRVRKPPGGNTNDVFNIEGGQKPVLRDEDVVISEDTQKSGYNNLPRKVSQEYAGITDQTRIRKPPGGDTNDIFGLEARQRSHGVNVGSNRSRETFLATQPRSEIPGIPNSTYPLKPSQLKPDEKMSDKENIDMLSGGGESIDETLLKKQLDEEDEGKVPKTKYLRFNPITGEQTQVEMSAPASKLKDCSNIAQLAALGTQEARKGAPRPSVRIRQPPGGTSSNIF